jgi:4-hydroxy-tetrahydrodipicolinate reductase
MTRILVNGAHGKMGKAAVAAITEAPGLDLVASLDRGDPLAQSIIEARAEVVLDLTAPETIFEQAETILQTGARPIIGTSGLTAAEIDVLAERSQACELGCIIAPNFSLSAVLMMRFATMAAPYFPEVEIIEMHHTQKKDSPSGTAIRTAALIDSHRNQLPQNHGADQPGRGVLSSNVPIHAVRLPGLLAHQTVIMGNTGETLTIKQDSVDRACFMPGILLCCRKIMGLTGLVNGLESLIEMP